MPFIKHDPININFIIKLLKALQAALDINAYQQILCDLILDNRSDSAEKFPVAESIYQICQFKDENGAIVATIKEVILQELHRSWKQMQRRIPMLPNHPSDTIPEILAAGYEFKRNRTKSIHVNGNDLTKLSKMQLRAFWLALQISGLESIHGINNFDSQAADCYRISCQGLAESHLTAISFANGGFGDPFEEWPLLLDAIKLSSITNLDLSAMHPPYLLQDLPQFFESWRIMCAELASSKLQALSLNLLQPTDDILNRDQWSQLYQMLDTLKIKFLALTCAVSPEQEAPVPIGNNGLTSWDLLCNVIRLKSLKHLKLQRTWFERIIARDWESFCLALTDSHLEKLDIELSLQNFLSPKRWLMFIAALKKMHLTSLLIKFCSTKELFTENIFEQFCDMIAMSKLDQLAVKPTSGSFSLTGAEWNMLANALYKRNIKVFDFTPIELTKSNLLHMCHQLETSGIDTLTMRNIDLRKLSEFSWASFSFFIKRTQIKTLDFRDENFDILAQCPEAWREFCALIVNTEIKSLYINFDCYNVFPLDMIEQFCTAIKESKLETLILNFNCTIEQRKLKMILNAINKSSIINLPCEYQFYCKEHQDLMSNTQRILRNRAVYKNRLVGLCATSFFQRYHATLTEQGVTYGEDIEHQTDAELNSGEKELLQRFS